MGEQTVVPRRQRGYVREDTLEANRGTSGGFNVLSIEREGRVVTIGPRVCAVTCRDVQILLTVENRDVVPASAIQCDDSRRDTLPSSVVVYASRNTVLVVGVARVAGLDWPRVNS